MQKTIEVNEKAYELTQGFSRFLVVVMKEINDNGGWSAADDIPAIIGSAVSDLIPVMANVMDMSEEYSKDPAEFIKAIIVGLAEMSEIFKKEA